MSAWLSVDSDDLIHLPSNRGHPNRSSIPMPTWKTEGYQASQQLLKLRILSSSGLMAPPLSRYF